MVLCWIITTRDNLLCVGVSYRCRMIHLVHLQSPLQDLHQTKESREQKNQYRHPERAPLRAIASIVPPLMERARARLIKNLFQDDQSVTPILEMLELSIVCVERSTLYRTRI
jgi:hypothetical protein